VAHFEYQILTIQNVNTGRIEYVPAPVFDLLSNKNEWRIVEPEQQRTPVPEGKSIRAESLITAEPQNVDNAAEAVSAPEPAPKRSRKRSR